MIVVIYHSKFVLWCGGSLYIKNHGLHGFTGYLLFSADMLSSCGKQCVFVFFILSAFVIKHSFDSRHYTTGFFYCLRFIRIYIPFLFSVAVAVLILFISCHYINPKIATTGVRSYNDRLAASLNDFSVYSFLKSLVFLRSREYIGFNIVYWSLLHEAIFYILFPAYNLIKKAGQKLLVTAALLTLYTVTGWSIFYYQVFFLLGLLFYELLFIKKIRIVSGIKPAWQLVLIFCAYCGVNLFTNIFSADYPADAMTVITVWLCFEYLLYKRTGSHFIFEKLGQISYSVYLNHFPLLLLLYSFVSLANGQLIFYPRWYYYAGILLVLPVCHLIYLIAEKPSLKLISNLKKNELHKHSDASGEA